MEATKNWEGDDVLAVATPHIGTFLTLWNALVDALMWPGAVEILHVFAQDTPQMSLADNHDVVKAVAPDAAEQSFASAIRLSSGASA